MSKEQGEESKEETQEHAGEAKEQAAETRTPMKEAKESKETNEEQTHTLHHHPLQDEPLGGLPGQQHHHGAAVVVSCAISMHTLDAQTISWASQGGKAPEGFANNQSLIHNLFERQAEYEEDSKEQAVETRNQKKDTRKSKDADQSNTLHHQPLQNQHQGGHQAQQHRQRAVGVVSCEISMHKLDAQTISLASAGGMAPKETKPGHSLITTLFENDVGQKETKETTKETTKEPKEPRSRNVQDQEGESKEETQEHVSQEQVWVQGATEDENRRYGQLLQYIEDKREEAMRLLKESDDKKEEAKKMKARWDLMRESMDFLKKNSDRRREREKAS